MFQNQMQFKRSTGLLIWMVFLQLVGASTLFVWFLIMSNPAIIFAGESMGNKVIFLICYPIFPFVMVVGAWGAYAVRVNWLAPILSGLSFAPGLLYLLPMIL